MKKITTLVCTCAFLLQNALIAQNTSPVCDSLTAESITIEGPNLWINVYNSSGYTIAYPYFTLQLDDNPYIQLNENLCVPTFLSVPSDGNGGWTIGTFNITADAASDIPLQTTFNGLITITDPNDATFSCTLPFSFQYGSMTVSTSESEKPSIKIFPNPAEDRLQVELGTGSLCADYSILDLSGRTILRGAVQPVGGIFLLNVAELPEGHYMINIQQESQLLHVRFSK